MRKKIAQGAEATIYTDYKTVTKERFEKKYRHPELDKRLRTARTRREAKVIEKLKETEIPVPKLVLLDEKKTTLEMEHIPGETVKEMIDRLEKKNDKKSYLEICREIGEKVAFMHNNGIVHQDLTTSNMIFHENEKNIYFIDFGLSFFSDKIEDYAVDLHLLMHALESRHHRIFHACFDAVKDGYLRKAERGEAVINRLEKVEQRGRNKSKH